jgi:hypothetical protein
MAVSKTFEEIAEEQQKFISDLVTVFNAPLTSEKPQQCHSACVALSNKLPVWKRELAHGED